MKIALFFNPKSVFSKLTFFFTGCYCYHVGHYDKETDTLWDMHLIRRSYKLTQKYYGYIVTSDLDTLRFMINLKMPVIFLTDNPIPITSSFLESKRMSDNNTYSFMDYVLFGLKPFYHLLGKSTPNAKGLICSEMLYVDSVEYANLNKIPLPFTFKEVPSPCDIFKAVTSGK